ncbi:dienelactone hydrolase family protein [Pestalotiopsis sp. NC0098]|nr:dienelactone hydrolase family protein [Pestalotiopsis sp. NC0098]
MSTTATRDACAELPPARSDYQAKGSWDTIAGLKTYISGPSDARRGVVLIYDVFGPAPQTLQGADRLAAVIGDAVVLVPDFFEGVSAQPAWMPADTEAKKAAFAQFRADRADIPRAVDKLLEVRQEAGERWSGVDDEGGWGVVGLCWGGKVGVLVSGQGNEGKGRRFAVSGTAHPSRLEAQDAEALNVPYICLASPGEPADLVAQYKEILSKPGKTGVVETYSTMFHGWMGARAKLDDDQNRAEYERGYGQIAEFFGKYLSS